MTSKSKTQGGSLNTTPAIKVQEKAIACDGGVVMGANHPTIYLSLKNGQTECPYCGAKFVSAP